MAFTNASTVSPRKNKPHICLREGWWRVSKLTKRIWRSGNEVMWLWSVAHQYAQRRNYAYQLTYSTISCPQRVTDALFPKEKDK